MDERKIEIEDSPALPTDAVEPKRRRKSIVREYAEAIAIAVLLALVIRSLVVQAFTIPSGSMMDTLLVGDYILVNKFLYGPELPLTDWHLPGIRDPRRDKIKGKAFLIYWSWDGDRHWLRWWRLANYIP